MRNANAQRPTRAIPIARLASAVSSQFLSGALASLPSLVSEVKANGDVVLSLTDMPRPFAKLKALDMEQVAADVVKALG